MVEKQSSLLTDLTFQSNKGTVTVNPKSSVFVKCDAEKTVRAITCARCQFTEVLELTTEITFLQKKSSSFNEQNVLAAYFFVTASAVFSHFHMGKQR